MTLKELAQKRLEVLQEFSSLGSGLHIAMKDMEIRGAGNVLGTQQHGNMDAIGFELYSRMLSQEVAHLKGEAFSEDFTPQLSLGVTAYFPKEYIPDEALKIEFYRRLAEAGENLSGVEEELKDRFGPLPPEAKMLLTVASFRPLTKNLGVQRLEAQGGWVSLQWHPNHSPDPNRVQKWFKQIRPRGSAFLPRTRIRSPLGWPRAMKPRKNASRPWKISSKSFKKPDFFPFHTNYTDFSPILCFCCTV